MNLFALTRNTARRIVQLPLAKDVQDQVRAMFLSQEREFRNQGQEEIVFDGKYAPEDGECLKIDGFTDAEMVAAIKNPISINPIRPDTADFDDIKALFSGYQDEGKIIVLLQTFDRRKVLSAKVLALFLSGDTYKKVEGVGLTIENRLSLIIDGDSLKFFSFHVARQIFDLERYYKEATDDDLKKFTEIKSLKANLPSLVATADRLVRKKITLVMQSGILEDLDIEEAKKIAIVFDIALQVEEVDGKKVVVLPTDLRDLKKVLRFLDEDYYQSPLRKTKYLSNSKRVI